MILCIANKENQLKDLRLSLYDFGPESSTQRQTAPAQHRCCGDNGYDLSCYISLQKSAAQMIYSLIMLSQMISFSSAVGVTNEDKAS